MPRSRSPISSSPKKLSAEPSWQIRRAVAGDEGALALVAAATFLNTYYGIVSRDDMLAHLDAKASRGFFAGWIADRAVKVLIAETVEGATPLGYAALTSPDLPFETDGTDLELRRIYTLAAMQGSGLAAALMGAVMREAAGARRVLLGVNAGNMRARRFYEKQGFAVVGTRQFQVGATLHDDKIYARAV